MRIILAFLVAFSAFAGEPHLSRTGTVSARSVDPDKQALVIYTDTIRVVDPIGFNTPFAYGPFQSIT